MNWNVRFRWVPLFLLSGCGTSLFRPLSSNTSAEAVKEDALLALDRDDYATAEEKLASLWVNDRSNEIAGLYAVAILGRGNFVLFDIIKNAILMASEQSSESQTGGSDIMDQLANRSTELLGGEVTAARQAYAFRALDILGQAENQSDAGITFQKCLAAGIYAVPVFQSVTRIQSKLTEIQQTQTSADICANASTLASVESDLTDIITEAGAVSASLSTIGDVLNACLPKEQGQQVNEVTSRVQKILSEADKGCAIDATVAQVIGSVQLPVCLNTAISGTTSEAVAGDGVVSGCELFLNCGGGSCFQ